MRRIPVIEDIEDNPSKFSLITDIPEQYWFEIVPVVTGEEGVEKGVEERPDLILMDIQFPGIHGFEATQQIRECL